MSLLLRGLRKSYGTKDVLKSLDLQAPDASVTAVLGANGAGKTTAVPIDRLESCAPILVRSSSTADVRIRGSRSDICRKSMGSIGPSRSWSKCCTSQNCVADGGVAA